MLARPAPAAVILDQTVHASSGALAPLGITPGLIGPAGTGGGTFEGPLVFTLATVSALTITAADLGPVGNLYEVLLDGTPLTGGPASYAVASAAAGAHVLDLWDYALTYLGGTAPNGVTIDASFDPDPVELTVAATPLSAVPAPPAWLPLALLTLAQLTGRGLRRRA